MRLLRRAVFGLACLAPALGAQAPVATDSVLPRAWGPDADRHRVRQLLGRDSLGHDILRSPSRDATGWRGDGRLHAAVLQPSFEFIGNTDLPFGPNLGSLPMVKGVSVRAVAAVRLEWGRLRAILAPEILSAQNAFWDPLDPRWFYPPVDNPAYKPWVSPWNVSEWTAPAGTRSPYSIDLPVWLGQGPVQQARLGHSSLWLDLSPVAIGLSTENQWWGPGIRNALLLSTNAAGFPHAFVRTAHPIATRAGTFEATWLLGRLQESVQFDTISANDRRSLAGAIVTWRPAGVSGLEVGLARLVVHSLDPDEPLWRSALDVFRSVGHPDALPLTNFTKIPGRDQLASAFFRWVFPQDGIEVYGEFGRAEQPENLRDFLIDPNHSLGSTLGIQWAHPVGRSIVRVQAERTFLEQSPTYTHRPMGSWYTSRAVPQGFTNDGKVLGATIGPGSSGQWLALDVIRPSWEIGTYFGRHRYNADAFFTMPWNLGSQGFCEFDTSLYPGMRGAIRAGGNAVTWDVSYVTRYNLGFGNFTGCPTPAGVHPNDRRSWSVSFSWWPSLSRGRR